MPCFKTFREIHPWIVPFICSVNRTRRGVQIEFSFPKIQITCSKIEIWIHWRKIITLPPIFYRCHWYIVLVIGSIPWFYSIYVCEGDSYTPLLKDLLKKKVESHSHDVILTGRLRKKIAFHISIFWFMPRNPQVWSIRCILQYNCLKRPKTLPTLFTPTVDIFIYYTAHEFPM